LDDLSEGPTTTENGRMSWDELSDIESRSPIEDSDFKITERLEALELKVGGLCEYDSQETTPTPSDDLKIAERLKNLEQIVEKLSQDTRSAQQESFALREPVLNSWCGIHPSSKFERRINIHINRGNILADIRAITAKESIHPQVAGRWKIAFLDRYGVDFEECRGSDHILRASLETMQIFNMRAYVAHRFQKNRTLIMKICDFWIEVWKVDHEIPKEVYRRVSRLYYES
jgi:hypothetical protein